MIYLRTFTIDLFLRTGKWNEKALKNNHNENIGKTYTTRKNNQKNSPQMRVGDDDGPPITCQLLSEF